MDTPQVRVGLVLLKDRKVLAVRAYGAELWSVPGGIAAAGETDEQVLYRAIQTDLGTPVQEGSLMVFGEYPVPAAVAPATTPDPSAAPSSAEPAPAEAANSDSETGPRLKVYSAVLLGEPHASADAEELAFIGTAERMKVGDLDRLLLDDLAAKGLID